MKRKERQRKFHDSLVNMLYAPSSPPPPDTQFDEQTLNLAQEIVRSDHHPINTDELDEEDDMCGSASGEEDDELGSQKLTRAQRKRRRKKKLKEAASRRRQIIGPQLPTTNDDQIDAEGSHGPEHQQPEGVRRNVTERPETENDHNQRGEIPSCIKVKHRRLSKKMAMAKPKTPHVDVSHGNETTSPGDPS